ncbi:hypothetical protein TrVE_jg10254 [Triparma verrucosa]|nr:hypothetical protein TrVE_jg10254 [Triparma verrucosa]
MLDKLSFQKIIEEGVAYWSFLFGNDESCDLLLRMQVERQDIDLVLIRVTSVELEELEATSLPNPYATANKRLRLLLDEGTIVLRPLPFGQTSFTFTAQVDVREVMKDAIITSQNVATPETIHWSAAKITSVAADVNSSKGAAVKKLRAGGDAAKGKELFSKIAEMFYEQFKKEAVIDARRKADVIENGIPNAPPLTGDEQDMIEKSMKLVEDVTSLGKRIAVTVND